MEDGKLGSVESRETRIFILEHSVSSVNQIIFPGKLFTNKTLEENNLLECCDNNNVF